jgi:hypothetical protein
MARKDGATIQNFQDVDGFNIPSTAVVRIAERHGYKASASKKLGEPGSEGLRDRRHLLKIQLQR